MTDDVNLVSLLLRLLDLTVNPVQVTPGIVKVEHQPKVEVVTEVGVHGEKSKSWSYHHLWIKVSKFTIQLKPNLVRLRSIRPGKGAQQWGQFPLGHPVTSLLTQ